MDAADDEKEASEILRSLLSVSRVQNQQMTEVNFWQPADSFHTQEQIVWTIDPNEGGKRQMTNDNRNIVHHIPVTYLTTDNRNISFTNGKALEKPITYVLSQNMISDQLKFQKTDINDGTSIILNEPQKVVLIRELDTKMDSGNVYADVSNTVNVMETRLYHVDGCTTDSAVFPISTSSQVALKPEYEIVDIENNNIQNNANNTGNMSTIIKSTKTVRGRSVGNISSNVSSSSNISESFSSCDNENINVDCQNNLNINDSFNTLKDDYPSIVIREDASHGKAKKRKASTCDKRVVKTKKRKKLDSDPSTITQMDLSVDESSSDEKVDHPKKKISKKNPLRKKKLNKRTNTKIKSKSKKLGKTVVKKAKRVVNPEETSDGEKKEGGGKLKGSHNELTKLEDSADQVEERFRIGCECSDYNCFDGLNPEKVFRHRLNIADLTKGEHDMYLMGVIMASMQNPDETCRRKERIRIRSSYAYQGKKVCLTAFLYLEHVTLYQMKRIRKHLKYHGVSPRIHGNHGRKPANTLSLDIYQHATNFVQSYIEKHSVKNVPNFTTFSSNKIGNTFISGTNLNLHDSTTGKTGKKPKKIKIANKMTSYHLPPDCTKKTVHDEYKLYCEGLKPDQKVMQYSTFTSFLKKQFPNVKFQKVEKRSDEKCNQTDSKLTVLNNQGNENEKKKKSKKTVELFDVKNGQAGNIQQNVSNSKRIQTPQVYVPGKNAQASSPPLQPPLAIASKQNHAAYAKTQQTVTSPVAKTSQIVVNTGHLQFCGGNNQVEPDIRLPNQVLVGNQIISTHCVNQAPSYTQHIYMQNIKDD